MVLYAKKEKIYPAYVSKHNSDHEKQVILLINPNREKLKAKFDGHVGSKTLTAQANSEGWWWHYFAVKNYHHY